MRDFSLLSEKSALFESFLCFTLVVLGMLGEAGLSFVSAECFLVKVSLSCDSNLPFYRDVV